MEIKSDGHRRRFHTFGLQAIAAMAATRTTRARRRNGQGSVSRKHHAKGYYTLTITRDYRKKVFYFHSQREAKAKRKELANQEHVNLGREMTEFKDLALRAERGELG